MKERNQTWNVYVHKGGKPVWLGTVIEKNEANARNAALSKFGRMRDDPPATTPMIEETDVFYVWSL